MNKTSFAIIETGGKQYLVQKGQRLAIEKLNTPEGESMSFDHVLLTHDNSKTSVGQPLVPGAKVEAKVLRHYKDRKVIVLKFKPKVRYKRKRGHRQPMTEIEVSGISTS